MLSEIKEIFMQKIFGRSPRLSIEHIIQHRSLNNSYISEVLFSKYFYFESQFLGKLQKEQLLI